MDRPQSNSSARRCIAYIGTLGTTQLHLRSPLVSALWTIAFPGLGHILLSKYIRGYLLFIWEIFINYNAHVNPVSYTHLRAHETKHDLVCRLLLEKKKKQTY